MVEPGLAQGAVLDGRRSRVRRRERDLGHAAKKGRGESAERGRRKLASLVSLRPRSPWHWARRSSAQKWRPRSRQRHRPGEVSGGIVRPPPSARRRPGRGAARERRRQRPDRGLRIPKHRRQRRDAAVPRLSLVVIGRCGAARASPAAVVLSAQAHDVSCVSNK